MLRFLSPYASTAIPFVEYDNDDITVNESYTDF